MSTQTLASSIAHSPRPVAEIAGVRRRLASMLYESLPAFGVIVVGGLVPHVMLGISTGYSAHGWVLWLHLFLLLGCYFILVWRKNGQTLAMQTWRLQIVDQTTGKPASLKQLFIRYIFAWLGITFLLTGIGILWVAYVDRERQFLHDRIAGTCIVFRRS